MTLSSDDNYSFGDNLTYMFRDSRWGSKVFLGALLGIVPVLNLVTGGYALRTINNIRERQEPPLPEWSDGAGIGKYLVDGLILFAIGLIYSMPLWLIGLVSGVPLALLDASSASGSLGAIVGGAGCLAGLAALAHAVLLIFWLQGVIVNFAVKGNFGAAFEFADIWRIVQANLGKMVLTVVAAVVAAFLVSLVSAILGGIPCCGGIAAWVVSFAASFYVLLVLAYACGHIARTV